MLKSSVWIYFSRWFSKLSGLISTLILARILTPDDFGVVASVAIVTSFFYTLSTTGGQQYLLRKKEITPEDLNTTWTIGFIVRTVIAIAIFSTAPLAADFFNDERLADVLRLASLIPILNSLSNIGMMKFQKKMNYKPAFKLGVAVQSTALIVKILLAIIYQNYWVFIIAELISSFVNVLGSYYLSQYRPKFELSNWREQWSFSQWVLAKGIFSNLRYKIDNILITKFFSAESLGLYSVAKDISTIPAGQIIGPITEPLYVGLAEHLNKPASFADKVHKSILAAAMIVFPIAFGVSALAEPIVLVLLGDKWREAIPLVKMMAFILLSGVFISLATKIFNVLGKVKASFYLDIAFGGLTIVMFVVLAKDLSLPELALLRVVIGLFCVLCMYVYLGRVSQISIGKIIILLLPVFTLAISMFIFVNFITGLSLINIVFGQLMLNVVLGVIYYSFLSLILVYVLKKYFSEYEFLWKTFYLPLLLKLNRV